MAKKLFRSLMLGIIIFSVAVLAGYLSYVVTYRYQIQKMEEAVPREMAMAAETAAQDAIPLQESQSSGSNYYVARLENNDISIYICTDGKESFLYTLDIYAGDLSEEDVRQLKQGVVLDDRQKLAAFEEDFTG